MQLQLSHLMTWQISCYFDLSEDRGCSVALHNSQLIYFDLSYINLLDTHPVTSIPSTVNPVKINSRIISQNFDTPVSLINDKTSWREGEDNFCERFSEFEKFKIFWKTGWNVQWGWKWVALSVVVLGERGLVWGEDVWLMLLPLWLRSLRGLSRFPHQVSCPGRDLNV